uniref:hypothetical protein n=1 Tax=Thalassospira povalilytica TaxID=732237 RepID=UPI003AA8FC39
GSSKNAENTKFHLSFPLNTGRIRPRLVFSMSRDTENARDKSESHSVLRDDYTLEISGNQG